MICTCMVERGRANESCSTAARGLQCNSCRCWRNFAGPSSTRIDLYHLFGPPPATSFVSIQDELPFFGSRRMRSYMYERVVCCSSSFSGRLLPRRAVFSRRWLSPPSLPTNHHPRRFYLALPHPHRQSHPPDVLHLASRRPWTAFVAGKSIEKNSLKLKNETSMRSSFICILKTRWVPRCDGSKKKFIKLHGSLCRANVK